MGLFSPNYNKPGLGVEKDAPQKPRFFIFFEVLKRKFWNLLKVNLMYVLFNIPALLLAFFVASTFMYKISNFFVTNASIKDGEFVDLIIRVFLSIIMVTMTLVTLGPVQAGVTYILRNYSREEHSFIWSDFKDNFVKNFKQGMIITIIDIFVMILFGIALNVYSGMSGLLPIVAAALVLMSLLIFAMMHLYIYPMLVTVKLSVKNIYKNAFILSILKLFPNILILVLNIVISIAAFYIVYLGVILYILLLPCFIGLMNNFYVNPIIKKYIVTSDESVATDHYDSSFFKKDIPAEEANELEDGKDDE